MDEKLATGAEYPTIELGGVTYEVKFTRSTLYRMGKAGIRFAPQVTSGLIQMPFHEIVDALALCIGWTGTADELAELCYDRRNELITPLVNAWAKVVLPSIPSIPQTAAKLTADQTPRPN